MHRSCARLGVVTCVIAIVGSVPSFAQDTTAPLCYGVPASLPSALVAGFATDAVGVTSVTLESGQTNLQLSAITLGMSATFTVTRINPSNAAAGTVLVQDAAGNSCKIPVQFVVLLPGAISNTTLCSGEGNSLEVSNTNAALPGGTSVCSANPAASDPNDPLLPTGYNFSPGAGPTACRSLSIASPITGTTSMTHTKVGPFIPELRLMFSKRIGTVFPEFSDITTAVFEGTTRAPTTKTQGSGNYSFVKVACAESDWALNLAKSLMGNADEDGSGDVSVGDTLTYGFVVTNIGTTTLTNVNITDPLSGLSALNCAPDPLPLPTLAPMATLSCTATYSVQEADRGTLLVNTATVTSDETPPDTDIQIVVVAPLKMPTLDRRGLVLLAALLLLAASWLIRRRSRLEPR